MNPVSNFQKNLSLAAAAILFSFPSWAQQEPPPAVVEVAPAKMASVASQIWVPGTVVSKLDSRIASEVRGRIAWIAEVGVRVEEGEPIAIIDDRLLQLEKRDRESDVARLDSRVDYLRRQVERLKTLGANNNVSVSNLDETRSSLAMTEQELASAQVALETTLYNLNRSRVPAPFSGVVVERMQMPGEFIEQGRQLVRLVNDSALEVSAKAPIAVSRFTRDADFVTVKGEFTQEQTPVRSVVPVGDDRSRMIEVRVNLNSGDWVIGEAVRVSLNDSHTEASVTVPRDALVLRDNAVYVYTVDDEKIAHRVDVSPGNGNGNYIAVEGEIDASDILVVRGAENLRDGQAVKVLSESVARL